MKAGEISRSYGIQIDLDHWKLGGVVDEKLRMRVENYYGLKDPDHTC